MKKNDSSRQPHPSLTGGAGGGSSEIWKVIPDFPRYEVSNKGRVRSNCCKNGRKMRYIIKPGLKTNGYYFVQLFDKDAETGEVKIKWVTVHRLVARAFIGECPPRKVCDHINGNKLDNRLENLRYIPNSENVRCRHTERFKDGFRIEVFRDGKFLAEVTSRKALLETVNMSFRIKMGGKSLNELFVNGRTWRYKNFVAILYLPIDSPPALPCREGVK